MWMALTTWRLFLLKSSFCVLPTSLCLLSRSDGISDNLAALANHWQCLSESHQAKSFVFCCKRAKALFLDRPGRL